MTKTPLEMSAESDLRRKTANATVTTVGGSGEFGGLGGFSSHPI